MAQQPTLARPAQALYAWPLAAALLLSLLLVVRSLWPQLRQQALSAAQRMGRKAP